MASPPPSYTPIGDTVNENDHTRTYGTSNEHETSTPIGLQEVAAAAVTVAANEPQSGPPPQLWPEDERRQSPREKAEYSSQFPEVIAHTGEHSTLPTTNGQNNYNTGLDEHDLTHNPEPRHSDEHIPPPAYSDTLGYLTEEGDGYGTNASVADDGRVNIRINEKHRRFSQIFQPALRSQLDLLAREPAPPPAYIPPSLGGLPGQEPPPPLNVVIQVVGSRGDVQPFVALGKVLKETYKHRVRLATHPTFKNFVEENGLEFFSISGDPSELMAFMVKNPGLMPGFETLRNGDVGKRRRGIADILKGCYRSCIEAGDGMRISPGEASSEAWVDSMNLDERPFVADAVIANPPSFAHIHIAEKFGIPLHIMFTMPWSPTQAFPHPLANIQSSNTDPSLSNYMSYALVDMLTWQGLGDVINRFRVATLGLEPLSSLWAPGVLARLRIPFTYCWSPALIPKPKDWGNNISIAGFYFLSLASNYTPASDLDAFLKAGPPPAYIGFGSIVVDDPNAMTKLIFEAVAKTGQRALVSKGWGGIGADEIGIPEGVFMLGNVPHDWLFKHVSCVVHHGGAGTTAAGIAAGRPTVVVPFFGDQPFWGSMVHRAGAGPAPIPNKQLTSDNLAEAILEALKPESLERASELRDKISSEKGNELGAACFHQMLEVDKLRCALAPSRAAVWRVKRTNVRLSALAATVLTHEGALDWSELKLYRPREYDVESGPIEPLTGAAGALMGTITTMMMGVADMPIETLKALHIHPDKSQRASRKDDSSIPDEGPSCVWSIKTKTRTQTIKDNSANTSTTSLHSDSTTPTDGSTPPFHITDHSTPRTSQENTVTSPTSPLSAAPTVQSDSTFGLYESNSRGRPSGGALAEAFGHSRSGSGSGSRRRRSSSLHRRSTSRSHADGGSCATAQRVEVALGTGKGVARIVGAGLRSPMDFSLGLSKGFHNLPKLYGEEVRTIEPVTGFQSGLKTSAKELGLGFYEGVTGLVTQPYKGAKTGGFEGFTKGFGRGVAGLILKPGAGIWALPGYAFKGIYKELAKQFGANMHNCILAARTAQGYDDWNNASPEERADILHRWRVMKQNLKKKKNLGEDQLEAIHTIIEKHREKKKSKKKGKGKADGTDTPTRTERRDSELTGTTTYDTYPTRSTSFYTSTITPSTTVNSLSSTQNNLYNLQNSQLGQRSPDSHQPPHLPHRSRTTPPQPSPHIHSRRSDESDPYDSDADDRDLELAIQKSIQETAHGDPEEAEMLERAIRASVQEMERHPESVDEEEVVQRAIRASVREAERFGPEDETDEDDEFKKALELSKNNEYEDHDEELKKALHVSRSAELEGKGEQELKRAIEESEIEGREMERQRTEEEIVLEYVKRQSLLEEEHRRLMVQGREAAAKEGEGAGSS